MTIVYSRIQATESNYMEKITKELDEDSKGLTFDFKNSNNDDIINVEYSGKLIAIVDKQGGDYIIERVAGTPQVSEPIQETEHGETEHGETEHDGDVIPLPPQKDNIIKVNFG